jgi:hypothetical protein
MDKRVGLMPINLAAYAPDVDVYNVRRWVEMKIPDVLQQHRPGYDPALVAD